MPDQLKAVLTGESLASSGAAGERRSRSYVVIIFIAVTRGMRTKRRIQQNVNCKQPYKCH